jgi:hypothetical protein
MENVDAHTSSSQSSPRFVGGQVQPITVHVPPLHVRFPGHESKTHIDEFAKLPTKKKKKKKKKKEGGGEG